MGPEKMKQRTSEMNQELRNLCFALVAVCIFKPALLLGNFQLSFAPKRVREETWSNQLEASKVPG